MPDPQLATIAALLMAVAWTMTFAGVKKHMLELKTRKRTCPACGRSIAGRTCNAH